MTKKLSLGMINTAIKSATKLHKETLDCFGGAQVFIKVLTHKSDEDDEDLLETKNNGDIISLMIYRSVVDEEGNKIFKDVDQIKSLPNYYINEMLGLVNKYNNSTMEKQAKK